MQGQSPRIPSSVQQWGGRGEGLNLLPQGQCLQGGHKLVFTSDLASGRATPAVKTRFVKFFWPVLAFALGCVAGGAAYMTFGFWCLLPALALLAFLVLLDWPALEAAPAAA